VIDRNHLSKWNIARAAAKINYLAFLDRTGIVRTKKLDKHDAELLLDGGISIA
jgi:hypothetical protein